MILERFEHVIIALGSRAAHIRMQRQIGFIELIGSVFFVGKVRTVRLRAVMTLDTLGI